MRQRRTTGSLHADQLRLMLRPTQQMQLTKTLVQAANNAAIAHADHHRLRQLPSQLRRYLESYGLLAFRSEGVDAGVAAVPALFLRECKTELEGNIVAGLDQEHLRPVDQQLGDFSPPARWPARK